ncbi:MAG: NAD(P)-dependent oxidoreductase [Actinomycetales bacterium]|nr:NAD(P)-dependent oxidoreductase [Actinomycetales bacterium]
MPSSTCVVTGGAGFIGCAMSRGLADRFDGVVAVDNLHPQVHPRQERPAALDPRVELLVADVTDAAAWDALLGRHTPQVIIHLAAETGTGQSLTEASRHGMVNVVGTTRMLDGLVRHGQRPERILLASSRAVYGEGAWTDASGAVHYPGQRSRAMLTAGRWDFPGLTPQPHDSGRVHPAPTSVYAGTKLAQEHLVTAWCLAMGVRPVLYRLQNVYGAGQSPTNPYTGIVTLFARLARSGATIPVYEDGLMQRDFVYVDDVSAALLRGLDVAPAEPDPPYDIGSGSSVTVVELARALAAHFGAPAPRVTGQFRDGDVRHASATIAAAQRALNWTPRVGLPEGIARLAEWLPG